MLNLCGQARALSQQKLTFHPVTTAQAGEDLNSRYSFISLASDVTASLLSHHVMTSQKRASIRTPIGTRNPVLTTVQPLPYEWKLVEQLQCNMGKDLMERRKCFLQVMPQLLSSLDIDDEQESALDWGTLAVYSCEASCDVGAAYAEEFVWVQP